jgi:hypothetical protein
MSGELDGRRSAGPPAAERRRRVRFPFPPLLFAVPLALAIAADRWVLRLPLPAAGRRGTRVAGAAVTRPEAR